MLIRCACRLFYSTPIFLHLTLFYSMMLYSPLNYQVESILGAIYIDSGQDDLTSARSFVYRHILSSEPQPEVDDAVGKGAKDDAVQKAVQSPPRRWKRGAQRLREKQAREHASNSHHILIFRDVRDRKIACGSGPLNVLCIGASSGVGAGLVERLSQRGPHISLCLVGRNAERLEAVAQICRTYGASVSTVVGDVGTANCNMNAILF